MTLAEAMPHEFAEQFGESDAYKHRDVTVRVRHSNGEADWKPWPGPHKNVHVWVELENGRAVGWNENPARGWSFPVIRLRK
jgi:hypothetical protein